MVGVVRDVPYRSIHEAILPVVYVPFHSRPGRSSQCNAGGPHRSSDPLALASILRREVRARQRRRGQQEMVPDAQTVRERLPRPWRCSSAGVALVLAGIDSMACWITSVGAAAAARSASASPSASTGERDIARRVTADVFRMVLAGSAAGLGLGMLSARYIATTLPGEAYKAAMLAVESPRSSLAF